MLKSQVKVIVDKGIIENLESIDLSYQEFDSIVNQHKKSGDSQHVWSNVILVWLSLEERTQKK